VARREEIGVVAMQEVQHEQDGQGQLVDFDIWRQLVEDYVYLLTGGRRRMRELSVSEADLRAWYDEGLDEVQAGATVILNAINDTESGIARRAERR
jgi:hypothetical protein